MDKSLNQGGGFPPPSGRYSMFSPPGGSFNLKPEPPGTSNLPPLGPGAGGAAAETSRFSYDISRMSDNPSRNLGHRRAHSEILTLPDDISFDSDLGVVGGLDGPSFSDETEEDLFSMYLDMDKFNSSSATSAFQVGESSSSAIAATTSGSSPSVVPASAAPSTEDALPTVSERPRVRHQHSQSMDGSMTIKPEMLTSNAEEPSLGDSKKAISAAKLAELALIDPKRAKRIWANRQSAARSKERKMRYIGELERKVQTLQTEATSLSAQLTLLQRDTSGLTAENSELKLRLHSMEQQVNLQDALNDALKEEIQHFKVLTGQIPNGGPSMMNYPSAFGANQQCFPNNHAMHTLLTAQQFQQLQINKQQHHQFQQHQLHQFQQQQVPHQQQQQQQPQSLQQQQEQQLRHAGDLKLRGTNMLSSPSQNDNASEMSSSASKD